MFIDEVKGKLKVTRQVVVAWWKERVDWTYKNGTEMKRMGTMTQRKDKTKHKTIAHLCAYSIVCL